MTASEDGTRQPDLALDFGAAAADDVARRARQLLIENKHTMSGDSGLRNAWEEIVVQVRGEQTPFWEAYEAAMRDAVLTALASLCGSDRKALWLKTDLGWDWHYDQNDESEDAKEPPVDDEAIVTYIIKERLIGMADNFSSPRIEEFLHPARDDLDEMVDASDSRPDQPAQEESLEIEYYDDTWDSSGYLACFDRHYICAIRPGDPEPSWTFLPTNGAHWDAVHQRVYRNFRANRIEREQLPPALPPPPTEVPPEAMNPPPPPPSKPIRTEDFPVVTHYLRACLGRGTAALHLVLFEDIYESLQGDGEFHYPEIVFFDLQDAATYKRDKSGGYKFHIRPGAIWLDGDEIGYDVPMRMFDHFSAEEVLRLVTEAIERARR